MTVNVERTEAVRVPSIPNYIQVDRKEWRPIHEFTDEALNVLAESWRKNLLRAAERGRVKAKGLPLPENENVVW